MRLSYLRALPRPDFLSRLGRYEFALLGALCAVAAIVLVFGLMTEEVLEGDTGGFDRVILLALRNPADLSDPIGPAWLERTAGDITALGGVPVLTLTCAVVVGFLLILRRRAMALLVLVSAGGGTLLSFTLKMFFERARPDLVPHGVEVFTSSFPSSHAMMSAMIYLTLGALLTRVLPELRVRAYVMIVSLLLTMLIGISRVYLGVHWPTDVLAGWIVGSAWAMFCATVAWWMQRRRR
ncbi:phosphatase PAP2 family protein [Geminicoccus roseus]|uniref:phosphatase PAP2 family protein n=1 Tax=Geminicoccus roseus TaxID=404900 RepID=UPI00041D8E92|nr:phosphatase PAP2 family protein [Geminicoccus roseus]